MRLTIYRYDGTPDEILAIQRGLDADANSPDASQPANEGESNGNEDPRFISERVAKLALTRRPLSPAQKIVLRVLYDAGEKWTHATELQKASDYTRSEFAGLMGAFGRRVTHTRGFKAGTWFFDWEWDNAKGCYRYRLPHSSRAAIDAAGVLR